MKYDKIVYYTVYYILQLTLSTSILSRGISVAEFAASHRMRALLSDAFTSIVSSLETA